MGYNLALLYIPEIVLFWNIEEVLDDKVNWQNEIMNDFLRYTSVCVHSMFLAKMGKKKKKGQFHCYDRDNAWD